MLTAGTSLRRGDIALQHARVKPIFAGTGRCETTAGSTGICNGFCYARNQASALSFALKGLRLTTQAHVVLSARGKRNAITGAAE